MEALEERKRIIVDKIENYYKKNSDELTILYNQKIKYHEMKFPLESKDATEYNRIINRIYEIHRAEEEKYLELYSELDNVEKEIISLISPIIAGSRVNLKKINDDLLGEYKIVLTDTNEIIGKIEYRGYHISKSSGDIGYSIEEEYRGNNYAYEALELLSEILFNNRIDSFWICASKKNYPSVNTLLKYGGDIKNDRGNEVFFVECETIKYNYVNNEIESSKGEKKYEI